MQNTIILYENFRSLFYTPFYLAFEIGAFQKEGVSMDFGECEEPGKGAKESAGRNDALSWGGPMRALHLHDKDPRCDLVCFCEVVGRDPFFIIGKKQSDSFQLTNLQNIRLGSFSEAVTPWLCLQDDCRRAGLDPDGLSRTSNKTVSENMESLRSGTIGAVQLHEPYAEILIKEGGCMLYDQAQRGLCSYTSLYTDRSMLNERSYEMQLITNAIAASLKWIHGNEPGDIASAVKPFFNNFSEEILASAIQRYKNNGIWNKHPTLSTEGFERLRSALLTGGLISRIIPYDEVVDTRFATNVENFI